MGLGKGAATMAFNPLKFGALLPTSSLGPLSFGMNGKISLFALGALIGLSPVAYGSRAEAGDTPKKRAIVLKKPKIKALKQAEFCPRLFEGEWNQISASFDDPIKKMGFKFGVGTKMTVKVNNGNFAEGVFLGRMVSPEGGPSKYMFYDYDGSKIYLLDEAKTNVRFEGKKVTNRSLQPIAEPIEQYENTCAAFALEYFARQLVLNGVTGNGKLPELLKTKQGLAYIRVRFMNYYLRNQGHANFQIVFRDFFEKEFGLKCRKLDYKSADRFVSEVFNAIGKKSPVLLEYWIGPEMVTSAHQWVDPEKRIGEDRRIWAPRKRGERESGGHAITAVDFFESPSGRLKLQVGDSDWKGRPVLWDVEEYLRDRKKSSGLLGHVCFQP